MFLPGGLWHGGERRRDFALRRLTGRLELRMAEDAGAAPSLPARVTAALVAALRHVGGERPETALVGGLAVADRQFLVRQMAAWLGKDGVWLSVACAGCGEAFDFYVEQSLLPVKEAGEGYPFVTVDLPRGRLRFRVPDGTDQEAVTELGDDAALHALVRRCVVEGGDAVADDAWSDEELVAVDAALEAVAPEVTQQVLATCPECGRAENVLVDPYLCLRGDGDELLSEVHLLASTYHWSEGQILALPHHRRRRYLDKLDRDRGMTL